MRAGGGRLRVGGRGWVARFFHFEAYLSRLANTSDTISPKTGKNLDLCVEYTCYLLRKAILG